MPRTLPAAAAVRVLICDDSEAVRAAIGGLLQGNDALQVVAHAGSGADAAAVLRAGGVDVVVLDAELAALPLLLSADRAVRVLMTSALTARGAAVALEALRMGAADYIARPAAAEVAGQDNGFRAELVGKLLALGRQCQLLRARGGHAAAVDLPAMRPAPAARPAVLAIGSSTGGPAALLSLFQALGGRIDVPILLTQHLPATLTPQLAAHIRRLGVPCAEAVDGEALRPGHVHLAPGSRHLTVVRGQDGPVVALREEAAGCFCRPAVDPMLGSLAAVFPGRVLALVLTGMGQDGLAGARRVVQAGGTAIAQDEASSAVWGMPGALAREGLCHAVLPLGAIAPRLLQIFARRAA